MTSTAVPTTQSNHVGDMEEADSKAHWLIGVDIPVFLISSISLVLFAGLALYDVDVVSDIVKSGFSWSTMNFGAYWQILMLVTFLIGLYLAIGKTGSVRLGKQSHTDMTTFKWLSVVMCTLLAAGGVFWAAAEPIAHFVSPPPVFGVEAGTEQAANDAMAQTFVHWGFLAWAIQGSLTSIILMHLHYEKGLPLKPRTLLYPIFGKKVMTGLLGAAVDACCVIAVVAGTAGPIGFLGLQVGYGLESLFGIPNTFTTHLSIILGLMAIYTVSAMVGIKRGIQKLSSLNVFLCLAMIAFILMFGPTAFIVNHFLSGFGIYLDHFFELTTYRGDPDWVNGWTVFFWGWFLGYGPLMAMFIARISRGRTVRQMILMISVVAPIITAFWFTIVGGSGIYYELSNPGVISEPFSGMNIPAALITITQQLPFATVISILFLILTTIFVATTGDSMTHSISMVMTGNDHPQTSIRVFWGGIMSVIAAVLVSIGSGGISALQSFIVITAVPISLILLPSLWVAPDIARKMAKQQGL